MKSIGLHSGLLRAGMALLGAELVVLMFWPPSLMLGIAIPLGTLAVLVILELHRRQARLSKELEAVREKLQQSEIQLESAQELSQLGTWHLDLHTGRIQWSRQLYRLFHWNAEQPPPNLEAFLELIHPDDRDRVRGIHLNLKPNQPVVCDFRLNPARGRERHFSARILALGTSGQIDAKIGTVQDITDVKKVEMVLRASEKRYRSVLNSLAEGVILMDREGRFSAANDSACRILGIPRNELLKQSAVHSEWGMVDQRNQPIATGDLPAVQTLRTGRSFTDVRLGFPSPAGPLRWVSINTRALHEETIDRIDGVVVSFYDVSEQVENEDRIRHMNAELETRIQDRTRQLRERVQEVERLNTSMVNILEDLEEARKQSDAGSQKLASANRELEAFSYSVSHDLRAPLRNVSGFVDLLQKKLQSQPGDQVSRYLDILRSETRRMGQLIDDLLQLSRIGRAELKRQRVAMEPMVRQVAQDLQEEEDQRNVQWRFGPLPDGHGDPVLLRQVWFNLLSNAHKYTRNRNPAVIEVGVTEEGAQPNETVYFVRDNGAGFDMKYASKLFGVFQRLHSAEEFEGTGIGLANVQRIVHRHGGRVWGEGTPGEGATFYFSLLGGSLS